MDRLKRAIKWGIEMEGLFLVRTTDHRRRNFVISVIVRSKKTGKLRQRHQLIYNSGDEGFSKSPGSAWKCEFQDSLGVSGELSNHI